MPARIVDEVPHNEKVTGVSHFMNDTEFVVQTLMHLVPCRRIPCRKTLYTKCTEIGIICCISIGERIVRQLQFPEGKVHLTARCDFCRILYRTWIVGEEIGHLFLGFQIIVRARKTHSIGIVECAPRLHAKKNIMKLAVFCMDIVHIIGGS